MFMVVADVRTLQKNNMVNVVGHFFFPRLSDVVPADEVKSKSSCHRDGGGGGAGSGSPSQQGGLVVETTKRFPTQNPPPHTHTPSQENV